MIAVLTLPCKARLNDEEIGADYVHHRALEGLELAQCRLSSRIALQDNALSGKAGYGVTWSVFPWLFNKNMPRVTSACITCEERLGLQPQFIMFHEEYNRGQIKWRKQGSRQTFSR
eukprot:6488962-Amphidinium_carterae.4